MLLTRASLNNASDSSIPEILTITIILHSTVQSLFKVRVCRYSCEFNSADIQRIGRLHPAMFSDLLYCWSLERIYVKDPIQELFEWLTAREVILDPAVDDILQQCSHVITMEWCI